MCGIVFAGGSLSGTDLEIFNQLLYCDVFRGAHATGIFAKRQGEPVKYCKAATEPYPFMQTDEYLALTQGETKYVVAPAFIVGHNRHATRGNAGDSKNAHPFQHGNITLVHNGTLLDQDLLPDSSRFVVDSENICYSIDKIGAAATIQRLDGAYTLIWHDASDDTLHIIRNTERPFHLAKVGNMDWFGASEEDMLMWILKRSKSHKSRITEHFECEVGVEYIFDVSGTTKRCAFKEKIKHELPTFTAASRYGYNYSRGWQRDSYGTSRSYPDTTGASGAKMSREAAKASEREKQNAVAIEANISARIDGRLNMCPHSWFPYTSNVSGETRGRISGWVYQDNGEYYEVDVHSVPIAMWEDCCDDPKAEITGTVVSIQKINGTVRAIISHPSLLKEGKAVSGFVPTNQVDVKALPNLDKEPALTNPDDAPFDVDVSDKGLPDQFTMENGMLMTRVLWGKHDHNKCGGCDRVIPWKDAVTNKAIMAYNCFWHEDCLKAVLDDNAGNEPDTFICASCGKSPSMSLLDGTASADRGEDICCDCGEKIRNKKRIAALRQEASDDVVTGISVIYVDKTTTAIIDDADGLLHKVFSREDFNRMIKMRDSDVAKFEDLPNCYVERRSANIFAYNFKRGENKGASNILPKKEEATSNVASFSAGAKAGSISNTAQKLSKVLTNGSKTLHVNKALWNQIGQCNHCYTQVPWRDAEACALTVNNRIICPDCRGK